ncbi:hypothetical protein HX810_20250 [Pseudomonas salomonii]|uniref:Uncharacterized protein n=1 Tax=Pseudomonas salomonii TaxID=191391 RepID=A0A7Y8GG23_9PSED|nr:hypothetical protein [Pseudomonas salomonii]NWF10006.1 hypothetical protein [Pseudomonas salomonii]
MISTFNDLIKTLVEIREKASDVQAWDDNHGEATLNGFADSGQGGRRSDDLQAPISRAVAIASSVLTFNQDEGPLDKQQAMALEEAGFRVLDRGFENVVVEIRPTEAALKAAESDEDCDHIPSPMELKLFENSQ